MWSSECKEKLQVSTLYIASWYQLTLSLLSCHFHHCLTSYNCCASCCRDNKDSVCKVHGTGYQAAVANVEAATHQKYIEFDLRYTLPLLRALSMGLHDDSIELFHLTSSPSRVQKKQQKTTAMLVHKVLAVSMMILVNAKTYIHSILCWIWQNIYHCCMYYV